MPCSATSTLTSSTVADWLTMTVSACRLMPRGDCLSRYGDVESRLLVRRLLQSRNGRLWAEVGAKTGTRDGIAPAVNISVAAVGRCRYDQLHEPPNGAP